MHSIPLARSDIPICYEPALSASVAGTTPLKHEIVYQWYHHSGASDVGGTAIAGANEVTYQLQEAGGHRKPISVTARYRLVDGVQNQTTEVRSPISFPNVKMRLRMFLEGPLE